MNKTVINVLVSVFLALSLALIVIISTFSIIQIGHMRNEHQYVSDFPVERQNILNEISVSLMDARRIADRMVLHIHDHDGFLGDIDR